MNRFHVRFTVPPVGGEQLLTTHDEDRDGGILLIAASALDSAGEKHGLALVADGHGLGLSNPGASVTSSLDGIVSAYRQILSQVLDLPEDALCWVQIDADGKFDVFKPNGEASVCSGVHWQAIPGDQAAAPRSIAAFLAMFPALGCEIMARLEVMAGGVLSAGRDGDLDLTQQMFLSPARG